jgi:MtN3 and saliva related transmembrane protein
LKESACRAFVFLFDDYGLMTMELTDIIGIAAGVCTASSLIPQLVKILKEKKAEDISMIYLFVLLLGLILWVWYGFRREDIPVIATNAFAVLVNIGILAAGLKYKN